MKQKHLVIRIDTDVHIIYFQSQKGLYMSLALSVNVWMSITYNLLKQYSEVIHQLESSITFIVINLLKLSVSFKSSAVSDDFMTFYLVTFMSHDSWIHLCAW